MTVTPDDIFRAQLHLGPLVRRLRVARSLTQKDLGHAAGYKGASAVVTISRIEKSQALPRLVGLFRLADALGVQPYQLLDPNYHP